MAIDLTNIVKRYGGQWVGLKDDQRTVIASGRSVGAVLRRARQMGHSNPILYKVPKKPTPQIG